MAWKLVSYEKAGTARAGLLSDQGVIDVADLTGRSSDATVMGVLEDFATAVGRIDDALKAGSARAQSGVRLLAPLPLPGTIYCAGANYADHAAEMARAKNRPPPEDPHKIGLKSWHFIKSSRSVVGPDAAIPFPAHSKRVDWEAELAVVIGRKAKDVKRSDARAYIAGYTIANDLSARDLSRRAQLPEGNSFRNDWTVHKSFDGACPMGPFIALDRDVANPQDLTIELDVNGVAKQRSNTQQMIYDIAEQIEDISHNITLWPGDVILTGTPAGVGEGRGEHLKPGDEIRIRIAGLGELVTRLV